MEMDTSRKILLVILNLLFIFFFIDPSYQDTTKDTIFQGEEIRDWEQLGSANRLFRLQFFSPSKTKHRYLGIFFNVSPGDRPIWIANRDVPISDASGSLLISPDGKLKISYGDGKATVLASSPAASNASVTLLHNGNLAFRILNLDGSVNKTIWQSYDYPTDTLVTGMRLGINLRTGHRWSLTASISDKIPASSSFTLGLDPNGTSQLLMWGKGKVLWSSGIWQNGEFSCARHNSLHFKYISNQEERYFEYVLDENLSLIRYNLELSSWITDTGLQVQPTGWNYTRDGCNQNMTVPACGRGEFWFEPRLGHVYGKSILYENNNMSLLECKINCVKNCSCLAYASISGNGTGCEIWHQGMQFQTTSDIRASSRQVFIRSDTIKGYSTTKWWIWLILGVIILVSLFSSFWVFRKLRARGRLRRSEKILLAELGNNMAPQRSFDIFRNNQLGTNMSREVPFFSLDSIAAATNNFAITNKLGEGGFGPVYKGNLVDGQEIAIKRLSRGSGQGFVEFKNEIQLIAKLQHNNLVRLLGCCIQADERILVYEYMTNKSLDFLLFNADPSKKEVLNWNVRLNIIEGVAQGLLYLHKYSRLRVIHRDLKASNILLDEKLNPKISDFGLARIFEIQQSEDKTKRIVGTYGYMSPEYAIKGIVSMKTDVFSFGILLLEIVSGKKNNSCRDSNYPFNLVGHAWELWNEDRALELMDPTLDESVPSNEVMRCIHVGFLCVQDKAPDRPSMSDAVSMLTNEATPLPAPKQPAFFVGVDDKMEYVSMIDVSISAAEPR